MKLLTAIAAAACAVSGLANADEVWTTDDGQVVYETDLEQGKIAVLSMEGIKMYVAGLAGEYSDRGSYQGIWMLDEQENAGEGCGFQMVRPGTEETVSFWGTMTITFIDKGFPATWIAEMGPCFDGNDSQLIGRPVVVRGAQ